MDDRTPRECTAQDAFARQLLLVCTDLHSVLSPVSEERTRLPRVAAATARTRTRARREIRATETTARPDTAARATSCISSAPGLFKEAGDVANLRR